MTSYSSSQLSTALLPPSAELIAYSPTEYVMLKVKLSMFIAVPLVIAYAAKIIAKAANVEVKKSAYIKYGLVAAFLFIFGVFFGYTLMLPVIINFLYTLSEGGGVVSLYSVNDFISFVAVTTLLIGCVFEMPLVMVGVSSAGLSSPEDYSHGRRYAYVGILIASAIITPDPSAITMSVLALPMIALYEIGIVASRFASKRREAIAQPE
jgi:sec-independent protein translocase protein TatC